MIKFAESKIKNYFWTIFKNKGNMTNANLNELVLEGKKMTNEQKMSEIKLSNYDKVLGFHTVIVKRNNVFKTIQAFNLEMLENTYTLDEMLIGNRIA